MQHYERSFRGPETGTEAGMLGCWFMFVLVGLVLVLAALGLLYILWALPILLVVKIKLFTL